MSYKTLSYSVSALALVQAILLLAPYALATEHSAAYAATPTDTTTPEVASTTESASEPDVAAVDTAGTAPEEELVTEELFTDVTPATEVAGVHTVPFYSQFADITSADWQGISCGIAALAMLIDFYTDAVEPDVLLTEGRNSGAYIQSAGWSHQGLINLVTARGLTGRTVGLSHLSVDDAFAELEVAMEEGPVMVSVHYTFVPTNPIPHLVVVNGTKDGMIYYNDPAEQAGGGSITIEQFKTAWKKRYIEIRPT